AQDQVRISHRRTLAASSVTSRSGVGSGALGADSKSTAGVDPGDTSSACAKCMDINHGDLDGQSLDLALLSATDLPLVSKRDIKAGTAHINGDDVTLPGLHCDGNAADHATGRAGE